MEVSRRWFLGGAIGVAAAAVLPKTAAYTHVLYGDGVHDDTLALQALLDGKAVHIKRDGVTVRQDDGKVEINGGKYLISSPLTLRSSTVINNLTIFSKVDLPYLLKAVDCKNVGFNNISTGGGPLAHDVFKSLAKE